MVEVILRLNLVPISQNHGKPLGVLEIENERRCLCRREFSCMGRIDLIKIKPRHIVDQQGDILRCEQSFAGGSEPVLRELDTFNRVKDRAIDLSRCRKRQKTGKDRDDDNMTAHHLLSWWYAHFSQDWLRRREGLCPSFRANALLPLPLSRPLGYQRDESHKKGEVMRCVE